MKICKQWDWTQLGIAFWSGVAIISLVNIGLILAQHNQLLYNEYIFGIAIVIIIVYAYIRSRPE